MRHETADATLLDSHCGRELSSRSKPLSESDHFMTSGIVRWEIERGREKERERERERQISFESRSQRAVSLISQSTK